MDLNGQHLLIFCIDILSPKFGSRFRRTQFFSNKTAGNLYDYSVAEALGQNPIELLADPQAFVVGYSLVHQGGELDWAVSCQEQNGGKLFSHCHEYSIL